MHVLTRFILRDYRGDNTDGPGFMDNSFRYDTVVMTIFILLLFRTDEIFVTMSCHSLRVPDG